MSSSEPTPPDAITSSDDRRGELAHGRRRWARTACRRARCRCRGCAATPTRFEPARELDRGHRRGLLPPVRWRRGRSRAVDAPTTSRPPSWRQPPRAARRRSTRAVPTTTQRTPLAAARSSARRSRTPPPNSTGIADRRDDALDDLDVDEPALAGAVEVDDVQDLGALVGSQRARDVDRIVAEHGRLRRSRPGAGAPPARPGCRSPG